MNLRKMTFVFAAIVLLAAGRDARADAGTVEMTGEFLLNSSGTTYISALGAGQNQRWAGYSFGTFDVSAGQTLALKNFYFENYAYNGGPIPPGGAFNDNWLDGSNTAMFRLFRDDIQIYQSSLSQSGASGNNRFWNLGGVDVNVLDGLASGSHTLSYTIDWNYNQWTGSQVLTGSTQSTSGGVATFGVVPEPSTYAMALAGIACGGYSMWRRRKRA